VLDAGGAVDEVPRAERPLLPLDEQRALAGEHQERLLLRFRVVEAVRLAGLDDADVDADVRKRVPAGLEPASRAERLRRPPLRIPDVHDEPAVGDGREA